MKNFIKRLVSIFAILCVLLLCSSCGSSAISDGSANYSENGTEEYAAKNSANNENKMKSADSVDTEESSEYYSGENTNADSAIPPELKLVYTGNLNLTTKEVDKADEQIKATVTKLGGYVEGYNRSKQQTTINIRIPSKNFMEFMQKEQYESLGTVYSSMSSEDITLRYSAVETKLKTLNIHKERLLSYLEKAANTQEMLSIEKDLKNCMTEIATLEEQMKIFNNDLLFSKVTVCISSRNVFDAEDASFSERFSYTVDEMQYNFRSIGQSLLLFILSALPSLFYLAIISGIVTAIVLICVKKSRKKKMQRYSQLLENSENTNDSELPSSK